MTQIATPDAVRSYWFETLKPEQWYVSAEAVDDAIRAQFLPTWDALAAGGCTEWLENAQDLLAYILVADQFSRNMFRGDHQSFATDALALEAARKAVRAGWDFTIPEPARQFFYLPYMHAEDLSAQSRCIAFFADRMLETGGNNQPHAEAHHWVIAQFGRFPYRNAALGRDTTAQEQAFLDRGGYRYALELVQGAATA